VRGGEGSVRLRGERMVGKGILIVAGVGRRSGGGDWGAVCGGGE